MRLIESVTVGCPYCGEMLDLSVDLSAGSQDYIEDCQVCCEPMEVHVEVAADGTLQRVAARRQDA